MACYYNGYNGFLKVGSLILLMVGIWATDQRLTSVPPKQKAAQAHVHFSTGNAVIDMHSL